MTEDQQSDVDASFVGVPANSLPEGIITPTGDEGYLGDEGPSAVVERARRLAMKTRRDNAADVDRLEGRIRWIYIAMVVFIVIVLTPTTQSVEQSYHNCQHQNAHALNQNKALDALIDTPGLKPATKVARHKQFQPIYDDQYHCSGIWPFQP